MSLQSRLLSAHAEDDRRALIGLYAEAAESAADETARAFFLTQAFVYALEAGDRRSDALRQRLAEGGRI